jgi:hypothetical protein
VGEPLGVTASESRFKSWGDVIDLLVKAIGALVALSSVVYLLGATVLAGRLAMYSLPWEIVINQLPQSFLVAIGLTEVIAPLIAIATLHLLILFLIWDVLKTARTVPATAVVFRDVGLWALGGLAVTLIARLGWQAAGGWTIPQALIAAAVTAAGAGAVCVVLVRFPPTTRIWYGDGARLLFRATVVALGLVTLVAWNAITLPMPYAQVCPTKSIEKANGWLIGQTSDRLLLGSTEQDRSRRHISLAPSTDALIIVTYQNQKNAPFPACPAIPAG